MTDAGQARTKELHLSRDPLSLVNLRRLIAFTRPHSAIRNRLVIMVVVLAVQQPFLASFTGWLISGPIAASDVIGIAKGVVGFVAWNALISLLMMHRSQLAVELGELVVRDLRDQIYGRLLRLPMTFFNDAQRGRLVGHVIHDVGAVRLAIEDVLFRGLVNCGSVLISGALMAWYDGVSFMLMVAMAPLIAGATKAFQHRSSRANRGQAEGLGRVTGAVAESVSGMRDIQVFVAEGRFARAFSQLVRELAEARLRYEGAVSVFGLVLNLQGQVALTAVLMLGGVRVLGGDLSLPLLLQCAFISSVFCGGISNLGEQFDQALSALAGAERAFALLDTKPDWEEMEGARDLGPIEGRVEFAGVSFAYQLGEPVIKDVSFVAAPRQSIALVGRSGSGKSTLVGLMAKVHVPDAGTIAIDGHDLRAVTAKSLHRQLAYVTQDALLFSGTVLENIRVGKPGASRACVEDLLEVSGLHAILESLPAGLETDVGEGGENLSQGQRQVICIARALLAEPSVLILDEALSSIDSLTEPPLQRAMSMLLHGRTSFIVAHRLSTITHADRILVFEGGAIVEQGCHTELLARGGFYARLHREFIGCS